MYKKIPLSEIEPSPFQFRREDNKAVTGIATTAALNSKLGILQAPLVRQHGDKYQIVFGHGRIEAAKLNGYEKITCRVEDLTDDEMKKQILVENVNRQDLTHEELMAGLEQYVESLGLDKNAYGFYSELSRKIGVHKDSIMRHYQGAEMYQHIQKLPRAQNFKPPLRAIQVVSGLPKETAYAVLVKADDMKWSRKAIRTVKNAMKTLSEETSQYLIYDKKMRTPHTVIAAISTLPEEQQIEVAKRIKMVGYDEEDAVAFVERVKRGEQVQDITVKDEYTETLEKFRNTMLKIKNWGVAHYGILGDTGWSEACEMFTKIEDHMRHLKLKEWDKL